RQYLRLAHVASRVGKQDSSISYCDAEEAELLQHLNRSSYLSGRDSCPLEDLLDLLCRELRRRSRKGQKDIFYPWNSLLALNQSCLEGEHRILPLGGLQVFCFDSRMA